MSVGRLPEKSTKAFSPAWWTWRIVGASVRVMVVPTELAVPVAVGMLLEVLEVQPLQSHPGPLEFPVDPGHVSVMSVGALTFGIGDHDPRNG
jgi:hypothetical protein